MLRYLLPLLLIPSLFICTSEEVFIRSGGNCKQDGAYVFVVDKLGHTHAGGKISASELGSIWATNNADFSKAKSITYTLATFDEDATFNFEEPKETSNISTIAELTTWYKGLNSTIDSVDPSECKVEVDEKSISTVKPKGVKCKHSHRLVMTPTMLKNLEANRGVGSLSNNGNQQTITVDVKNDIENAPTGSKKYNNMYANLASIETLEHQHDIIINCLGEDLPEEDTATTTTTTTSTTSSGGCQLSENTCIEPKLRDATQFCTEAKDAGVASATFIASCSRDNCVAKCSTDSGDTFLYPPLYNTTNAAIFCTGIQGTLDETCP